MTAARALPARTRPAARKVPLGLLLGAVVVTLGALALAVTARSAVEPLGADAAARYDTDIQPIVTAWGRLEVQGMRPAVADLRAPGGVPAESIAGEAAAWQAELRALDARLAAVEVPPALRPGHRALRAALADYIDAAVRFEAAAAGPPGEATERSVAAGIDRAERGAQAYDRAVAVLQGARRSAGLSPSEVFAHGADP